ncbi:hypothetical protein NXY56_005903 [Leishmania guyanensis]
MTGDTAVWYQAPVSTSCEETKQFAIPANAGPPPVLTGSSVYDVGRSERCVAAAISGHVLDGAALKRAETVSKLVSAI